MVTRTKFCRRASPFFKIEARPLGERVRFFAQVAAGAYSAMTVYRGAN
jgi:hypothetical protein